jgi:hypothetical protein
MTFGCEFLIQHTSLPLLNWLRFLVAAREPAVECLSLDIPKGVTRAEDGRWGNLPHYRGPPL